MRHALPHLQCLPHELAAASLVQTEHADFDDITLEILNLHELHY